MAQIKHFDPELYGWEYGLRINSIVPVWCVGPQLPPALCIRAIEKGKILQLLTGISHMDEGDEVSEVQKVNYGEKGIII